MNKFIAIIWTAVCVLPLQAHTSINLSGSGWMLFLDKDAQWKNDKLFLPGDYNSIEDLPYNTPTMGWHFSRDKGLPVSVPGTLEEYLTNASSI